MKKQKLFLLLTVALFFTFSCGNTNKNNFKEEEATNAQTDGYAALRGDIIPSQKPIEDLTGKVVIITEDEFIERITSLDNPKGFQYLGQVPCVVLLYADWCKPCGFQTQIMREIAPDYQGKVIFYWLNVDRAHQVKRVFNVESIPMLLYFRPHREITTTIGYLNKEKFIKAIDDLLL